MFYAVTGISFLAFIYIISSIVIQSNSLSLGGLTGNAVLDLNDTYIIGDRLTGNIILNFEEVDNYGFLILTKGNETISSETFNLREVSKKDDSGRYMVKLESIMAYQFNASGDYHLFFSVPNLNFNVEKQFVVE